MTDFYAKAPTTKVQFFKVAWMEDTGNGFTLYPKRWELDAKGNVVYEKNDPQFYCKSLHKKLMCYYRGGLAIEKCTTRQRVEVARTWMRETGRKLPRKIKKALVSTRDRY